MFLGDCQEDWKQTRVADSLVQLTLGALLGILNMAQGPEAEALEISWMYSGPTLFTKKKKGCWIVIDQKDYIIVIQAI